MGSGKYGCFSDQGYAGSVCISVGTSSRKPQDRSKKISHMLPEHESVACPCTELLQTTLDAVLARKAKQPQIRSPNYALGPQSWTSLEIL